MTQDERWQKKYEEVVGFVESNRRNPSRHRIEEHDMLNWCKANRKAYGWTQEPTFHGYVEEFLW